MRISDWSSDVCSSDLTVDPTEFRRLWQAEVDDAAKNHKRERLHLATGLLLPVWDKLPSDYVRVSRISARDGRSLLRSEEHTSELQSLMRISYAVFCLKKKTRKHTLPLQLVCT